MKPGEERRGKGAALLLALACALLCVSCSTEYTVPEGTVSIVNRVCLNADGEKVGGFGDNVKSVVIPEGVTTLGKDAFKTCRSLTSVSIPSSVTEIGDRAFSACGALTALRLPDSVVTIGKFAFSQCDALESVELSARLATLGESAFAGCESLTSVSMPSGAVDRAAFSECTELALPERVTTIGVRAFHDCGGLTTIAFPDSLTEIGYEAFKHCEKLTGIVLPNGLTTIGRSAFCGCTGLTELALPGSLTMIGEFAFEQCAGLTKVTLPKGLTSIGYGMFSQCGGLTEIAVPDELLGIGGKAFAECGSLKTVYIPGFVAFVGENAFSDCANLAQIACQANARPAGWSEGWLGNATPAVAWGRPKEGLYAQRLVELSGGEPPYRLGYDKLALGWNNEYAAPSSGRYALLPREHCAESAEKLGYCVGVETKLEKVGQYTYGGSAYSWRYHISVRNAYTSETIAEDTLYGGSPPASFTGSPGESMTGAPPSDEDGAACIEALYAQALAVGTAE